MALIFLSFQPWPVSCGRTDYSPYCMYAGKFQGPAEVARDIFGLATDPYYCMIGKSLLHHLSKIDDNLF